MGNPTALKREKEKRRQERARDKAARRQERGDQRASREKSPDGVDPDIAHIVPGPQPPPQDWED